MSELEATSPPPQQAQPDLGPRKDGAPGATNKALHDQRYYKDRVCDAPRKLATVAPPKKIGGAPRPKKRLDPKLGDLDSYRVVACDAPRYSETVVCDAPKKLGKDYGPAEGSFLRDRGSEAFRAGKLDDAELAYIGALKIDEDDAKASGNLAAVYLKKKNWAQAFTYAAGAVRTAKPGDPVGKWNYRVARALFALRQYDKCVLILDRAVACADCRADAKLLADCLATKKAAVAAQERRRDLALEKVM
ncbi:peptide-aspartate beta-dioxygenase [Aureococcus anophagefferens]|nr:peptide-aspartate beta-dioxygenase [Aureococcus anophagefferens]